MRFVQRLVFVATFCALVCALGCREEQPTTNNTKPPGMQTPTSSACSKVKLAATAGKPLDSIDMGLDAVGPDEYLLVEVQYDEQWRLGVLANNDGRPTLVMPIHPDGVDGGVLNVRFIDDVEASTCMGESPQVVALTIEALDRAPGATTQYVDTFVTNLSKQAQLYGWTLDELSTTPMEDIPIPLWAVAHQADMMQGENITNNVRRMLMGQAPAIDEPADEQTLALIDALVAKLGINGQMALANKALDELKSLNITPKFERVQVTPSDRFEPTKLTVAELFQVDITTPDDLSFYMRMADIAERTHSHPAFKTAQDMSALLSNVPRIGKIAKSVGAALGVVSELTKRAKYFLPSRLQAAGFSVTKQVFKEDDDREGTVEFFRVKARSERWKISQDIAEQLAGLIVSSRGKFANKGGKPDPNFGKFRTPAEEWLGSEASSRVNGEFDGRVKSALSKLFDKAAEIYIGPFTWGPYDLSEFSAQSYAELDVFSGDILEVPNKRASTYRVIKVGAGELAMWADPVFFPPLINERLSRQEVSVKVDAIQINLTPRTKTTAPGEEIEITANVTYANDKTLEWETTGGTLTVAGDTLSATLKIPDPKPEEPIRVTVKSLSTTGLRAPQFSPPERSAFGVYGAKETISISPSLTCLPQAEPVQFKLETTGIDEADVVWEATQGTVTQAGVYTPPSADGFYEVVAYAKNNRDVRSSAAVKVGKCRCYFYGFVEGQGALFGPRVNFTTIPGAVSYILGEVPSQAEKNSFNFTLSDASNGTIIITDAMGQIYISAEGTTASTTYTNQGDKTVIGKIEGAVIKLPPDGENAPQFSFQIDFKGERSDGTNPNPVCDD